MINHIHKNKELYTKISIDIVFVSFLLSGFFFLLNIILPTTIVSITTTQMLITAFFILAVTILSTITTQTKKSVDTSQKKKNALITFIAVCALPVLYFATNNFMLPAQILIIILTLGLFWIFQKTLQE